MAKTTLYGGTLPEILIWSNDGTFGTDEYFMTQRAAQCAAADLRRNGYDDISADGHNGAHLVEKIDSRTGIYQTGYQQLGYGRVGNPIYAALRRAEKGFFERVEIENEELKDKYDL